jgi:hypothetical protein
MHSLRFLVLLTLLAAVVCAAGLYAHGQQASSAIVTLESADLPAGAAELPNAPEPVAEAALLPVAPVIPAEPASKPAPRKIVDAKYLLLGALVLGLTTADVEMTQHCLHAGTCYEMNPTLPHSRLGMYAVNTATNAAVMYFAYRRRKAGKWGWWVAPVVDIGAHGVGVGSNLRFAF